MSSTTHRVKGHTISVLSGKRLADRDGSRLISGPVEEQDRCPPLILVKLVKIVKVLVGLLMKEEIGHGGSSITHHSFRTTTSTGSRTLCDDPSSSGKGDLSGASSPHPSSGSQYGSTLGQAIPRNRKRWRRLVRISSLGMIK